MACLASFVPILYPVAPGIPRLTKVSTTLPVVVASAISSKGLILSKNCSTAAAPLVPNPKSTRVAPKEINSSGILKRPDPTPAKPLRIELYSSSSLSLFVFLTEGLVGSVLIILPSAPNS